MALAATLEWDIRTTGSDSNGGAFLPGATGTDFSQQAAAQIAFTDLVIGGTTTQLTSALNPFGATHVGNIINITSGTGFTTGRYQVISVAGVTATMDRSVGTGGSTGGHGNLGGSLATVATVVQLLAVSGNIIHVKAGTYTTTVMMNWRVGFAGFYQVVGYGTTHYDRGTKPLFTTATSSIELANVGNLATSFSNCSFSSTAGVRGNGIVFIGTTQLPTWTFIDCLFDGFTNAINGSDHNVVAGITCIRCEIKNCSTGGVASNAANCRIVDCYIHDNTTGYGVFSVGGFVAIIGSLIVNNSQGFSVSAVSTDIAIIRSTIANNSADGVVSNILANVLILSSSIFYGNGGWGINMPSTQPQFMFGQNNAYGANSSGDRNHVPAGVNDVALSADPFANSAGRDYGLNGTGGGGTACKGFGYPGAFPGGLSTGHLDIGAVQTSGSGGSPSGGGSYALIA